jgi:metal-responsive CopG/Arc/MetJ family transcriptional regulator
MKTVQITFDEALLDELDATEEVRQHGRSALVRRAASEYLCRRRRHVIADSYRRAYHGNVGLGKELEGWEEQGEWPAG